MKRRAAVWVLPLLLLSPIITASAAADMAGRNATSPPSTPPLDDSPDHPDGMDMTGAGPADERAVAAGLELANRIAAASAGDTIVVEAGTYRGNFVVNTPITLRGHGMPTLDGGGGGTVLTVTAAAHGTTVSDLHVMGSGPGPVGTPSGVLVKADGVTVQGVTLMRTYMGIQVMGVSDARIIGNTVEGFADGAVNGEMHATGGEVDMTGMAHGNSALTGGKMRGDAVTLWNAVDALVEDNTVRAARDGIYMSFAENATIRNNDVRDSRYAIHGMYASDLHARHNYFDGNLAGAILMYGGPFDLRDNTIVHSRSPSTGIGLLLKDGSGAMIVGNVIASNRVGIKIDNGGATSSSALPATVRSNTIGLNQVGVEIMQSSRVDFSRNSFVENTVQVVTDGRALSVNWAVNDVGNHWSSYKGYDIDGDGVGDLPFVEGGSIEGTLARSPVLVALMSGPAFRLLQAVEDRWAPENPVVRDPRPLTRAQTPTMESGRRPEAAGFPLGLVGGLTVAVCALLLFRSRPPRTKARHV